jgi:hypothetical protein
MEPSDADGCYIPNIKEEKIPPSMHLNNFCVNKETIENSNLRLGNYSFSLLLINSW